MGDAPAAGREYGPPDLSGVRVLVVEDNADFQLLLCLSLEIFDARVRGASSVEEAREILRGGFRPDVLVSDIAMPGEDGNALIRWVRALPPEHGGTVPALALTGLVGDETRARALQAGFQMYLAKPINPYDLVERVAALARPNDDPAAALQAQEMPQGR